MMCYSKPSAVHGMHENMKWLGGIDCAKNTKSLRIRNSLIASIHIRLTSVSYIGLYVSHISLL